MVPEPATRQQENTKMRLNEMRDRLETAGWANTGTDGDATYFEHAAPEGDLFSDYQITVVTTPEFQIRGVSVAILVEGELANYTLVEPEEWSRVWELEWIDGRLF
jgi:hypothetical protein